MLRHPFAGIIGLEELTQAAPSRRTALKVLAGIGTTLASGGMLAPEVLSAKAAEAADAYAPYLVVPRDFRTFRTERRQALGVLGDYYRGVPESKNLRDKSGFLAWLTADEAKKVAAANDVAEVIAVAAEDKPGPGIRRAATKELRVQVVPGGWKTRPAAGSFTPTDKLIAFWAKEFVSLKEVTFKPGENDASVVAVVGEGEPPKELISGLKEHLQVVAVEWKYPAVTERVGEDGGATTLRVGEEGGVTTKALGEEGGTTERLGEEGGPTTRAIGEEGGPTTLRVGEEGGPTTKALGEEGGGGGSTERLGEEGGATTLALGEEGGGSTRALGEEGGGKPRVEPMPRPKLD
jgi:hypothetical protein